MDTPVVMVVDDQSFVCDLVKRMLKENYIVRPFTSGDNALKYIFENHVDIVLLDYDMPNMTGYDVLMDIRANPTTRDIPVIFVTGIVSSRLEAQMYERGATDYLLKPIQSATLHRCIEKHLGI